MVTIEQPDEEIGQKDIDQLCILALNKRSWHHPKSGGAELNLEETLKRLAKRGHQVHLLTGSDEGRVKTEHDNSVSIRRIGFDHRFSPPFDVVVSYLIISIYFYWYLFRISPDIVYTVNSPLPWPVVTRRPRVTIFHHIAIDSFFDTHPFPQNLLGYISQWLGVLREWNNPTVSVSPSTTEELVSRGHDPDTVNEVRNGLNLEEYSPETESPIPRIVYIGGFERYKGADRIPEIHQALQKMRDTPVHLDIAGRDGPIREKIVEYCEETDEAHYHGFVSEEKKINLLQSAWVFIAPSRMEGWGIAVLEANACGTPAVGSNVNGLRDSIQDEKTGLLVDGSETASFAAQINDLLIHDKKRRIFSKKARSWAEQHSWEDTVIQLEEVFYQSHECDIDS